MNPYPPCERTPTEGDTAAAKGAFQAGNGSFNEADYDRAITYWEDAYRRDCTAHPLLLNLARAYELNNQKRHAVNALQTFMTRNPGSSEEAQIKRRIEKLNEQLQAEAGAAPPAAAPPAGPVQAAPVAAPPAESPPPPADGGSVGGSRPILPLIVAGAGGVVAITGGIIYITASSDVSDFEDKCPDRQCPSNITDDANSARTRMNVGGAVAIVGGAALAGGLVWYFLSPPEGGSAIAPRRGFTATVTPTALPGYGGLSVAGRF